MTGTTKRLESFFKSDQEDEVILRGLIYSGVILSAITISFFTWIFTL